ncbi:hypothetical protein ACPC37_34830 [Streptomyces griseoincarnatus]|uniref:hypothetical protein n=1 Tax=Paenibacillus glucanolyticus TaxID=59843 RepID=UPI00367F00D3
MKIGHKFYFDKITGVIIQHVWEASGEWIIETSKEKDFTDYPSLSERNPDTVGVLKLEYGKYSSEDFISARDYRINPDSLELEFSYTDPNDPETPPVYRKPLTEEVDELNTTIGTLLMESANDKATISSLEETVGTLLFEVAALKGGVE